MASTWCWTCTRTPGRSSCSPRRRRPARRVPVPPDRLGSGAPAWATYTDGFPTCTPESREDSPAVRRAWENFYGNPDGIRTELSKLWGTLAAHYADEPTIAGFDLLNEPGPGFGIDGTIVGLTAFYREAIGAPSGFRRGGRRRSRPHRVLRVDGARRVRPVRLQRRPQPSCGPHNYAESIGPKITGLMDLLFGAQRPRAPGTAPRCGRASTDFHDDDVEKMARYAPSTTPRSRTAESGARGGSGSRSAEIPTMSAAPTRRASSGCSTIGRCGDSRSDFVCSDRAGPRAVLVSPHGGVDGLSRS